MINIKALEKLKEKEAERKRESRDSAMKYRCIMSLICPVCAETLSHKQTFFLNSIYSCSSCGFKEKHYSE